MAETIKGINVVIGAETTGLQASLGDVNKRSKDIQTELKQVEKLLKLDPTNTELVAQKQKLLTDAVANTGEKLDRLRAAQEQVNQQFARGDISEGQYRAFQREIAKTEQELKGLADRLEETGAKADNLGDRLNAAGDKMKGAGEKLSVGLTAPIVAAGGVMLKGAVDAEAAQGKLQASLGLTAAEAEKLEKVAKSVWTNGFGESIEEVNQAIATVRKNMGDMADKELQEVTEGAMTIAQVFDQDVNEVTRAAGVMMKNFKISGKDALDLITVGFQQGGDFSGELLDTLREYSPQFVSLGLSADQALGMLISGAQAGAWNLDKVGDAMKEFNIRAQDGSKTTADGFAAIGLNAQEMGSAIAKGGDDAQKAFMATIAALANMKDPIAQNAAGVALFGTQWEDVRAQVITAMADGVKGLDEFEGATEAARKAIEDNNPGLAIMQSLRSIQAAIGPALLPIADIITNTVAPALKSMAEGFSNLSPGGKKAVLAIVGIIAAIGPLLGIVGSAASLFASLSITAGAMGISIGALVAPIAIAVAAIAGAIAIGVLLYKNWDEIKETLSGTWKAISDTATGIWNGIKDFLKKWGDELLLIAIGPAGWAVLLATKIADNWTEIKKAATTAWEGIKTGIGNVWTSITSSVGTSASNLYTTVKNKLEDTWSYIKSIPSQAWDWGKDIINRLVDGFKSIHIPTPHFSIGWDTKTIAGKSISIPDFDVNWYDTGGIFDHPSIIGVSEKRREVVTPLEELPGIIAEALGKLIGSGTLSNNQLAAASPAPIQLIVKLDSRTISEGLYVVENGSARAVGKK